MKKNVRLISKLEIKGPNLIKGIQFDGYRVLGKAKNFAELYYKEGIDELIYQDTVASLYQRDSLIKIIEETSRKIFIPLTVAGGIRTIKDISNLLNAGADKVAINTAACNNPSLLKEAAKVFGSQCIVASIETYKQLNGEYEVWTDFGREVSSYNLFDWILKVVDLGVGEIIITSIYNDGLGCGFDLELASKISNIVDIPLICCGGAGNKEDLYNAVAAGCDGVTASSLFHYHYALEKRKEFATYTDARLRMGKHLDTGNLDFLNHGYGKQRALTVTPCNIPEAKNFLWDKSINIRPLERA